MTGSKKPMVNLERKRPRATRGLMSNDVLRQETVRLNLIGQRPYLMKVGGR